MYATKLQVAWGQFFTGSIKRPARFYEPIDLVVSKDVPEHIDNHAQHAVRTRTMCVERAIAVLGMTLKRPLDQRRIPTPLLFPPCPACQQDAGFP